MYALGNNTCPYFFIPEINLLKEIPSRIANATFQVVKKIEQDTEPFIPGNVEEVIEKSMVISAGVYRSYEMLETFYQTHINGFIAEYLFAFQLDKKTIKAVLSECISKANSTKRVGLFLKMLDV